MRILIISHLFPNSSNPAAGIWLYRIVRGCRKLGHDICVINPDHFPGRRGGRFLYYLNIFREMFGKVTARQSIDTEIPSWHPSHLHYSKLFLPGPFRHMPRRWAVNSAFRRIKNSGFQFDLLHCVTSYHCGVPSLHLIRYLKIPLIVTEISSPYSLETVPDYKKKSVSKVLNLSSKVIGISPFMVREVEKEFPFVREKLCHVYFPTSKTFLSRTRAAYKGGPLRLVTICFVSEQKGLVYMLEAIHLLKKRNFHVFWTIAGDGGMLRYLKGYANKLGLDNSVEFLGFIPNDDLGELLAKSHLFVLPSLHETQAVTLIEALSVGLPCIYTLCGGPEDYMQSAYGIGVPPGNPEALANAVQEISKRLNQFEPIILKNFVQKNFSEEVISMKMSKIYEEVLHTGLTH